MRTAGLDASDFSGAFIESAGFVSMEAEHFTKNVPAAQARWEKIEGYGRTLSGMAVMPVAVASVLPPNASPRLEYTMYLFNAGKVSVLSYIAPTLNFNPDRGLRIAISMDNETPLIIFFYQDSDKY